MPHGTRWPARGEVDLDLDLGVVHDDCIHMAAPSLTLPLLNGQSIGTWNLDMKNKVDIDLGVFMRPSAPFSHTLHTSLTLHTHTC